VTDHLDVFLAEGMKRFKQASATMVAFEEALQVRMRTILSDRAEVGWGSFVPNGESATKSSRYWKQYPGLSAWIDGTFRSADLQIHIAINWYSQESDSPLFCGWLYPFAEYRNEFARHEWSEGTSKHENGICIAPCEDDLDLERDYGLILDELVRFLDCL
jgi:hypothetical protein